MMLRVSSEQLKRCSIVHRASWHPKAEFCDSFFVKSCGVLELMLAHANPVYFLHSLICVIRTPDNKL